MRALRLPGWKSGPELVEVPDPEPGPGQVVIRVEGAGACHSDLHLMRDFEPGALPWDPPFTLGHENAGRVHALGEGVTGLEAGQPVAVYGPWGCGVCPRCQAGIETYCENPAGAPVPGAAAGSGPTGAWPSTCSSRTRACWSRCPRGWTRSRPRRSPTPP
ncbi:alcohol dehydrogenase catalytic domain-containing protein [Planomonospora algeriensis]